MFKINDISKLLKTSHSLGKLSNQLIKNDKTITKSEGYHHNGALHFLYYFVNGKLQGKGQQWFSNGVKKCTHEFNKGIFHGQIRTWYHSGALKEEGNFVNGSLEGVRREWYLNGKMKSEYDYKNNKCNGLFSEWYEHGMIKEQGSFSNGKRHGMFKEYNKEGALEVKQLYIWGRKYQGKIQRLIDRGALTAKVIKSLDCAAIRRFCLEELGYARFLNQVDSIVVQEDGEQKLLKIDWHKDEEPIHLVKVKCPTTHVFYALRVPPQVRSVKQAVAWTFGLKEEEYCPQEES